MDIRSTCSCLNWRILPASSGMLFDECKPFRECKPGPCWLQEAFSHTNHLTSTNQFCMSPLSPRIVQLKQLHQHFVSRWVLGDFWRHVHVSTCFFSVASPTSKWFQRQSSESFRSFTSRSVGLTRTLRCTNPLLFFCNPAVWLFQILSIMWIQLT